MHLGDGNWQFPNLKLGWSFRLIVEDLLICPAVLQGEHVDVPDDVVRGVIVHEVGWEVLGKVGLLLAVDPLECRSEHCV